MLAIFASLLFAAFPVRGSTWQSLDSNVVIDSDTISARWEGNSSLCPGYRYTLNTNGVDPTAAIQPFPGRAGQVVIAQVTSQQLGMDASGFMVRCSSPTVTLPSPDSRMVRLHLKNHDWALWADSIVVDPKAPVNADHGRFEVRWRWSRIDTALQWVRWVDTVYLNGRESPIGLPVLTTLRPTKFDPLYPESAMADLGLVLRTKLDSTTKVDWGYSYRPLGPTEEIPASQTFRVADAYDRADAVIRWMLLAERKSRDSLYLKGKASSPIRSWAQAPRIPVSSHAYEPSTGRPYPIGSGLLPGLHAIPTPSGLRLVVVK
ncbi:MAG: hypothetical protein IPO40_00180 [Fibrobacteres bacterium]|nr:hypothetical protein [Fibrobacterota bacterium]